MQLPSQRAPRRGYLRTRQRPPGTVRPIGNHPGYLTETLKGLSSYNIERKVLSSMEPARLPSHGRDLSMVRRSRLYVNHTFGRGTENEKGRSKMFPVRNILNRMMSSSLLAGMGFAALLFGASPAAAATSPALGAASSYAILAGSAVTNTGATTIAGDVGIYPGIGPVPHYTGFGT